MITSNKSLAGWRELVGDRALMIAIIDRLHWISLAVTVSNACPHSPCIRVVLINDARVISKSNNIGPRRFGGRIQPVIMRPKHAD